MSITYCVCVCVALAIQHEKRMRNNFICSLPRSKVFFPHYLLNRTIFGGKKFIKHKMCVLISSTPYV